MNPAWNYPGFYPVHYALMRCIAEGRSDRAYRLALELAHYVRAIAVPIQRPPSSRASLLDTRLEPVALPLLLLVFLGFGWFSLRRESATFDETTHLPAGVTYLDRFDFRHNPEHPPLAKMWGALPVWLGGIRVPDYASPHWVGVQADPSDPKRSRANQWAFGFEMLNGGSAIPSDSIREKLWCPPGRPCCCWARYSASWCGSGRGRCGGRAAAWSRSSCTSCRRRCPPPPAWSRPTPRPPLASYDYGLDSDFVRVRVLGELPRASSLQFIGVDLVEKAMGIKFYNERMWHDLPKIIGVDVARFGDSESVIVKRQGLQVVEIKKYREIDLMTLAAIVAREINEWGAHACFVDVTGIGAGVVDRLRQIQYPITEINFGGRAEKENLYKNKRAEMWARMREWLQEGGAMMPDDRLRQQRAHP